MWKVHSPNGRLSFEIDIDSAGEPYYQVLLDGITVIGKSAIRFRTEKQWSLRGASCSSETEREIRETYSLPAGKKEIYTNHAMELKLEFPIAAGKFILEARAFDDGAAFRCGMDMADGGEIVIQEENTEVSFPADFNNMWLQEWVDTYEGPYESRKWEETTGRHYGMPCLFHAATTGIWVMISEAGLWNTNGTYCSSHLKGREAGVMELSFAPEQTEAMRVKSPSFTPWRTVNVVKDLNDLINSTLVWNLNPPASLRDTSWIHPGRNIWSWWSFENGAQLFSEQKKYVDFAAAYGFESITVDAGWDDTWVEDLCGYAKEKKVSVWLWSDMQALDTLEKAKEKIPRWAQWGVTGLKVDFFMNDSMHTMWQYQMIADIMTENKLMINFHGSTKPAGEGRTYPNLMTEEGIMGLEHYKWSDMPNARHNCTVPYTRNVVGSMDYTVTGISNRNRNTTQAHQLALSVVFESGTQHYADSIYTYEVWSGTDFLRRCKVVYDEVRLLDGFPGKYALMMRRKGREWYIGGITDEAREITIPLDYLPDGSMEMEIYSDGDNALVKETAVVSNNTVLTIPLKEKGGVALYIADTVRPLPEKEQQGYMTKPWKLLFPNEDGKCEWTVEVPKNMRQTLRICYEAQEACSFLVKVNEEEITVDAEAAGLRGTKRVTDTAVMLRSGSNSVSLISEKADKIHQVSVIDWALEEETWYGIEDCVLSGGARVEAIPDRKEKSIRGIGKGGAVEFTGVKAEKSGKYMLLLDYYSGENRNMEISVNGEAPFTTVLFNSSGWGAPRWDIIARKEVQIFLKQGVNTIRLQGKEAAAHIGRIGIRKSV